MKYGKVLLALLAVLSATVIGCGSNTSSNGSVASVGATARFLNGATPVSSSSSPSVSTKASGHLNAEATPTDGNWILSPDKIKLTLTNVTLNTRSVDLLNGTSSSSSSGALSCEVTYDIAHVGLAQLVDCPFTISPGTYTQIFVSFDATYQVLVNDSTHGFYTTATALTQGPAPEEGADYLAITTNSSGTTFGNTSYLAEPLTVADGDTLTLSVVINGLQFLHVNVDSGTVSIGWPGTSYADDPFRPDMTASVTAPATMGFYVAPEIGTALSYNVTLADVVNTSSVSVFYSSASTPTFLLIGSGTPSSCGPVGVSGVINGAPTTDTPDSGGYLGLDAKGVLGWAVPTDNAWTTYAAEFSMIPVSALNDTTTLNCKNISTDPAPSGGTFASGAPDTSSPDYSTEMVLVAQ